MEPAVASQIKGANRIFFSDFIKGQCDEIFDHFWAQKTLPRPHMIRQKRFSFLKDIRLQSSKFACPRCQRQHTFFANKKIKKVENLVV